MAIVRTVLPRKGIIEPQHGASYESDLDTNWQIIDSLLQDANDVQTAIQAGGTVATWLSDTKISGVVSGFALSTSASLVPGLASGVLYAQGSRYAPATAPVPPVAPASGTNYLFYNFASGFYYQTSPVGATSGDALIGQVVTSASAVTAVTQATKIYGVVALAPSAPGNFTVQHFLGRAPIGAAIRMTSGGAIWWQSPTDMDGTNLYLVASDSGVTAKVILW
jgi:hypothetical protein